MANLDYVFFVFFCNIIVKGMFLLSQLLVFFFLFISTWYNFVNFFSKDIIFSLVNLFVVILILINCFFVNTSWFSLRLSRLSFLFADSFYFQVEFLVNNFYNLYNLIPFLAINNISMSANSSVSTFSLFSSRQRR